MQLITGGCADSAITLKLFFDFRRYQRGNIQASHARSDAPCISGFAVRKYNHSELIIHESSPTTALNGPEPADSLRVKTVLVLETPNPRGEAWRRWPPGG